MIANWLPEDLLKTIVLFELQNDKQEFIPHGTGVLTNYKQAFILITCRHVVINPRNQMAYEKIYATVNRSDGIRSRKDITEIHKNFNLKWFFHKNENVDLAIAPIAIEEGVDDIKLIGEDLYEEFEKIPLGDDIFFLGYPFGLGTSGVDKLSPLVRTGLVALKNSDKTFLIDANVYPGSSGSPVFYKPVLAEKTKTSTNIGSARQIRFLGIINENINSQEEAISSRTGRINVISAINGGEFTPTS